MHSMKMIVAIIRPEKLEEVQQALNSCDVYLMTVSDVRGCGRQRGFTEVYRGAEFQVRLLPKLKLEIAVEDACVQDTIRTIQMNALTGKTGDGVIFVMPLDNFVHIRSDDAAPAQGNGETRSRINGRLWGSLAPAFSRSL